MLTYDQAIKTIKDIQLKGILSSVSIIFVSDDGTISADAYIQLEWTATCNVSGVLKRISGRKWRISGHMTVSEWVQTVFLAAVTAMEHEVRESVLYKGVTIFDPHMNLEELVEFRRRVPLQERT